MLQSRVKFEAKLPGLPSLQQLDSNRLPVLIFDQKLKKSFGAWIEKFEVSLPVSAGEGLKTLSSLERILNQVLKRAKGKRILLISFGGGSVTDFVGFLASVLHRGTPVVHIPSTWLAAIDSAHGGKTALNVGAFKNQLGTFWAAKESHLVAEVLLAQPPERIKELTGELIKTSLLRGDHFWRKASGKCTGKEILAYLPEAIQFKYEVVKKDPFEEKGLRSILNFGHTIGHILELSLGIPHGEAVRMGLCFDLEWSAQRGHLKPKLLLEMKAQNWWKERADHRRALKKIKNPSQLLALDKKNLNGFIRYTFLKKPGQYLLGQVQVQEVAREIRRQVQEL